MKIQAKFCSCLLFTACLFQFGTAALWAGPMTARSLDGIADCALTDTCWGGSGIQHERAVVDQEGGIVIALSAHRRFGPDGGILAWDPSLFRYFSDPGFGLDSGGNPAVGLATWNFNFHIDLGGRALSEFDVVLEARFDSNLLFSFDFGSGFPPGSTLLQDSQNLGFFGLSGFDPFAEGVYEFTLRASEKGGPLEASVSMQVAVGQTVDEPASAPALALGMMALAAARWIAVRRRVHPIAAAFRCGRKPRGEA